MNIPSQKEMHSGRMFDKWKGYYKLHELVLFSELHFTWTTSPEAQSVDVRNEINCCIGSPSLHILDIPVRIRIRNEKDIENVVQFQPFTVEYEITNLTPKCIPTLMSFSTQQEGFDGKLHFMIAGELKSHIYLMPDFTNSAVPGDFAAESEVDSDAGYSLKYTMFPLTLGRLPLPMLTLSIAHDRKNPDSHMPLIKDFTKKIYVTSS